MATTARAYLIAALLAAIGLSQRQAAAAAPDPASERLVASDYLVSTSRQVMEIGQVNPAAALALIALGEQMRIPLIRLANGEFSFIGGAPTPQTVAVRLSPQADETAIAGSMNKMAEDRYAIVRWQTMVGGSQGKRLLLEAREIDKEETIIRTLYPDVVVDLMPGKPASVISWSVP